AGAGQINLITGGNLELNFWNANGLASGTQMGGGSGVWSGTNPNWTDAFGTLTAPRWPLDAFAIFGGAAGTVTVDGSAGPVATRGMQFASDGYHLAGDSLALVAAAAGTPSELRVGVGNAESASWTATVDNVLS
ncbi:autotransporter outer membrane beta-barrel domain-containing protein, partial [Pseudomonas sp. Fl5BN2]|nr:autotransporter outer membrane beta-barrel domain-containing protein [Pseudomonas sp. Fl5BN2]